jgi:restriction system protein
MRRIFISHALSDRDGRELSGYIQNVLAPLKFEILGYRSDISHNSEIERSVTAIINKCDVFLCYSDTNNPNVMFELGYALGANKKVVLIGDAKSIPLDLRNTLYIRRGASPFEIVEHLERYTEPESPPPYEVGEHRDYSSTDKIGYIANRPEVLSLLEPNVFQELVADWFSSKGFCVEPNQKVRDSGYDFTISPFKGQCALVEVKKYKQSSQVPVSTIRQLVGSMAIENVKYGVIVSSAPFTQAAVYFASKIGQKLLLLTLEDLDKMKQSDCHAIELAIEG